MLPNTTKRAAIPPSPRLRGEGSGVRGRGRGGFTLIELLVVIGLILVLMSMGMFLVPSINSEQQATQAGTQLQQWLEIAKQRAGRDRAQRGVRLLLNGTNALQVTQLEYIEQPPDFFFGTDTSGAGFAPNINTSGVNNNPTTPGIVSRARCVADPTTTAFGPNTYFIRFEMFDSSTPPPNNVTPMQPTPAPKSLTLPRNLNAKGAIAPVQPGDHLEFGGQIYLIVGPVPTPNPPNASPSPSDTLIVMSELNTSVGLKTGFASTQYRIIRQPRPIGDDPLQMPANIIIDLMPRGLGYDLVPPTTAVKSQILAGLQTITPLSMQGITTGTRLLIGAGLASGPDAETVTVQSVTATGFVAQFANAHPPPSSVIIVPAYLDILFSPDGRVLGPMAAYDKIILWVRDVTVQGAPGDPPPCQKDPALVCIYPRTGLVAAYPVDTYLVNSNPYTNTITGRRSSQ
jgi:prepilin-type N-terminal cleavage/methylation domain-containing protein